VGPGFDQFLIKPNKHVGLLAMLTVHFTMLLELLLYVAEKLLSPRMDEALVKGLLEAFRDA
jgi:hypothetical protein